MSDPRDPAELVTAAAEGDRSAWDELEARFSPRMWSATRALGLNEADAADAVQGAWLRLIEHLHDIRNPTHIGAWLATTARREALLILRKDPVPVLSDLRSDPDPAAAFLEAECHRLLRQALQDMHEPCRTLLTLCAKDLGNQQVAMRLGIPKGSVGPTKSRCLAKLRTLLSLEEPVQ